MKKLFILTLVATISANAIAQIYVVPEQNVECSIFLSKERKTGSQQGLEIHGDYIFCLEDGGHVNVYDFRKRSSEPVAEFELASSRPDNHANNASFGIETAKGASFPLMYITNGKVGSEIEWTCFVESITKKGRNFSSELVQTIRLDISGWEENGYAAIFGAPSWMIDKERKELWVFSARKRTVSKVTKNAWENQYIATKFRIPALSEGPEITLGTDDILDQAVFPFETWFTQAGCAHDGKIYYCFGLGRQDPERPSRIRVYDTDTRTISARYELQDEIPNEMEDIAIRDGWMYVNTNTKPGKDTPHIYKVSMPKPKPLPSSPAGELLMEPEKAGGIYYVHDLAPATKSKAPEGYKPFYINGYFRHGARHIDDKITYEITYDVLENASRTNNLTDFGQAIYDRLKPFRKNIRYREGDLTQIGYAQGREIGIRMAENYPEVFQDCPYLKANATNVLRVSATMQSLIQGISSVYPELEWSEIDNSRAFLPHLNPYGTVNPEKLEIDAMMHNPQGPWYKKYCSFRNSKIDADAFLERFFKDTEIVKCGYDAYEIEWRFWLLASVMQCLDRQVPLWDMFTKEEILAWAEVENYKYYAQKGPDPVNLGRGWGLGSRTLRHLIEESRKDIEAGRHGADLNFGHDGTLMALMTNLGAGTWNVPTENPSEVIDLWQYWNIPMGCNLQMIFYRNDRNPDDIIVKFMLNEKDLKLPLKAQIECFYKWDDVYSYYIRHCEEVEKSLEKTRDAKF